MSEPKLTTLSKSKIAQKIDLEEIVGKDISNDPALVAKIGQAMVDYMLERVDNGKGIGGVKLASPYSESYAESLDFKAAGKSKRDINMKLTGDMLSAVDFDQDGNTITLKIDAPDQAIKAYGHQTGFEGHPTIKGPKRPFFGLSLKEIKNVASEFKSEVERSKDTTEKFSETQKLIKSVSDLFDGFEILFKK